MQNILFKFQFVLILSLGCHTLVFSNTTAEVEKTEQLAVRNVILAMNQAVTEQNLAAVVATFENETLIVDLFPSNYKKPEPDVFPKTSNLNQRWQSVFKIMNRIKIYERIPTSIAIQVDGAMASAWVNIQTRAVYKDHKKPEKSDSFYELLLLKKIDGQWKIMLTSNNRHDSHKN